MNTEKKQSIQNKLHPGDIKRHPPRGGKILILMAILLPSMICLAGLVIDGGLIMSEYRNLQHAADAASTAAAMDLKLGKNASEAIATAENIVINGSGFPDATVTVNIPPTSGNYAGEPGHVEVLVESEYRSWLIQIVTGLVDHSVRARSVAGVKDVTDGAAIVVLDPDPNEILIPSPSEIAETIDKEALVEDLKEQSGTIELIAAVPVVGGVAAGILDDGLQALIPDIVDSLVEDLVAVLPDLYPPSLIGGMEVEGIGCLMVDGAIHVNTEWGGQDENGDPAGSASGPPYAISCMPILPTTQVRARSIRVVGGVDNRKYYKPFDSNEQHVLQANRLPVEDPLASLPVPTVSLGASSTIHNPADQTVLALSPANAGQLTTSVLNKLPALLKPLFQPLIAPVTSLLTGPTIEPGVYNSLTVLSPLGGARFEPGVYIIRGTSPTTHLSLCILGPVEAEGVLFYITDSSNYNPSSGLPDVGEDPNQAPDNTLESLLPSAYIVPLLPNARISGLNDPGNPLHGMLVYQHRVDRRPIVIEAQQLIGSGNLSGTIYSKWGHVIFLGGGGSYDLRFVTGTLRVVTVTTTTLAPSSLFPPAQDVLLLE